MNAKSELLDDLKLFKIDREKFKFAIIRFGASYFDEDSETEETTDFDELLEILDQEYNDGFGGQELFGYILFNDGSWLERHEYDGSEEWHYKKTPTIEECRENMKDIW